MGQYERIVAVIPAYKPSENFVAYAQKLTDSGICGLVVVNDGSGSEYDDIFSKLSSINNCHVITHSENKGKGCALKSAFAYCKQSYDDSYVFVTADCDGQHTIKDVIRTADFAREYPNDFVLGARDFSNVNVPKRSRMGNVTTRKLFSLLYGVNISDTQTGLRAFSYGLLDMLRHVFGMRFEYEMNQLIVLHKKGVVIRETPIGTVYDTQSSSHYRTLSDSIKVFGVLLKNLGWYAASSGISALTDTVVFYVALRYIFTLDKAWLATLAATVTARVLSSIINFTINFKFVFNGKSKKSILRYYTLWICQLGASYGLAFIWQSLFPAAIAVTVMKAMSDICLAVISYQVQCNWVFAESNRGKSFWGFAARVHGMFIKKYRSLVTQDSGGAVYFCKANNTERRLTVAYSLGFDTHMAADDAPKETKPIASNGKAMLNEAERGLKIGQSILTFTNGISIEKDLLALAQRYHVWSGRHLRLIPLVVDDAGKRVIECRPLVITDFSDNKQTERVTAEILSAVNQKLDS